MEAIIFWWPAYRLARTIKLLTGVVSWGTVLALVPVVPRVLQHVVQSLELLGVIGCYVGRLAGIGL